MPYVIRYYKNCRQIGSIPSPGPLATTKSVAQDGLIRHQAEFYQITDDATGKQVAMARNGGRREEQDEP